MHLGATGNLHRLLVFRLRESKRDDKTLGNCGSIPPELVWWRTQGESIYPKTWSNPSGAVLLELQPDLWVAERPFVWNNIDVGGKMAVIRLTDGSLWVHSPVSLDEPLRTASWTNDWRDPKKVITVSPCVTYTILATSVHFTSSVGFRIWCWRGELWRIWALWST